MTSKYWPAFAGLRKLFVLLLCILAGIASLAQQSLTVTGTVTMANGSPVAKASVREKNTTNGTTTDAEGNFSIAVPSNAILVFSYVGLIEKEVPVNGSPTLSVTLEAGGNDLDQVVVVGYGSRRKRDITAAISQINVTEIGEMPARTPTQLLQGQAPGVVVKQKDGRPGAEMEVRVRGIGSIGANSEPLYVIDGLPVGTILGPNYNPNDIESITVLKDAASTAIYGARGSNGVVLITTKSSKEGKLN